MAYQGVGVHFTTARRNGNAVSRTDMSGKHEDPERNFRCLKLMTDNQMTVNHIHQEWKGPVAETDRKCCYQLVFNKYPKLVRRAGIVLATH